MIIETLSYLVIKKTYSLTLQLLKHYNLLIRKHYDFLYLRFLYFNMEKLNYLLHKNELILLVNIK